MVYILILPMLLNFGYCRNENPIIGILSQKYDQKIFPCVNGTSFISSSYVKFLESAGAQVVPITTDMSSDQVTQMFSYINGVLLPGGDADLMESSYRKNAELIFKLAIQANENHDYFPIWGTCLGFQALCVLVTRSDDVISASSKTWDKAMPLNFTENVKSSRLFSGAPMEVLRILESENVTYNAHRNCVSSETYETTSKLHDFFSVLSTNEDMKEKTFISTIEARNYPFYGVQWHPEMNIFEFGTGEGLGPNINHSVGAVLISQYTANFFVNEARRSKHKFPDPSAKQHFLIYNYTPLYTGSLKDWFGEQTYIF